MLNIDDRLIKEVLPKIGPNALSVLLAIAIHLNQKTNRAFPSHSRLMELTGLGRDAVYGALSRLQNEGLLRAHQQIDSEKKVFGRRVFCVSTAFISVFVSAQDAEPLPEKPYTGEPYTGEPYTANTETYQINKIEQINKLKQINKGEQSAKAPIFSPKNKNENSPVQKNAGLDTEISAGPPPPVFSADGWKEPEVAAAAVADWLEYKANEKRFRYRTQKALDVAAQEWKEMAEGNGAALAEMVRISIRNGWSGLFPVKRDEGPQKQKKSAVNDISMEPEMYKREQLF